MHAASRTAVPLPTGRFAALVAISGLLLFAWPGRDWRMLIVVEVVLAAVFVFDAVRCTSPKQIVVTRTAPEVVTVGDEAELSWVVENHSARAAQVRVADALWPSLQARRRRLDAQIAPRGRVRIRTTLQPTRRGRFPLDEVTVRVTGPLRLSSRQASRSLPAVIRVLPAYPSRDEVLRRLRIPRVLETGQRIIRTPGGGTEFDQLRDYRPDDEFRRIDWPSTMRLQRPTVKQYRVERNQNVVLLLDNGRVMAGTVGGVARVEHAMDAVLAVTHAATGLGDRVGLVTFDRQVRSIVASASGAAQVRRAAEAMFMLEPELVESAYTDAFSAAAARFRRRSLYVVMTDLVDATVDQSLLPAMKILTRTHLVVVAGVQDPTVAAWAAGGEHRWPSEAFREAAAIGSFDQRARAVARLRRAGAVVVDAEPTRLGIELVDTYLTLKASGRL
jgi:uncharacterized protein (DUF58 family)